MYFFFLFFSKIGFILQICVSSGTSIFTYVPLQSLNAGGISYTKLVLFKHCFQSVTWVKFCLQNCAASAVSCQYNSFAVPAVFTKIQRMKAGKYKAKVVSRYFWFLNVSRNFV